jgi:hypothetical protein
MTLSTLQTMNVPLAQLRESIKVRAPASAPAPSAPAEEAPPAAKKKTSRGTRKASPAEAATPAVDPMQWWGALTKQFTQLAATAMKDSAGDAAKSLAGSMVKQSFDAAEQTLKKAVTTPAKVAGGVAKAAVQSATGTRARKRAERR